MGMRPLIGYGTPFMADVYSSQRLGLNGPHSMQMWAPPIYGGAPGNSAADVDTPGRGRTSGGPLDSMLSQYRQGTPASDAVPATPSTPGRPGYDVGPTSFFSATGAGPTGGIGGGVPDVSAGATSTGTSPFGVGIPDLSQADPATLRRLQRGMEGLIWNAASTPGGGYIHGDHPAGPGTNAGPYYIGQPPADDPNADRAARSYFNYIGSLPTRPIGTSALNRLPGYSPSHGPSYNQTLGQPYGGPYTFPGWNPFG